MSDVVYVVLTVALFVLELNLALDRTAPVGR